MTIEVLHHHNNAIAFVTESTKDAKVITDVSSILDLLASVSYQYATNKILISKALFSTDFFILSTGLAGEILQKLITYGMKIAIFGDYSVYTSKPLQDFIYESNKGKDIFFVSTKEEGLDRLAALS
ncbi:MAG: DUF4180 domain-containing protein [Clostridiales bacterium]|nr:DUF4180 domain-containing protein [Clostridiales bacterium]